MPETKPFALNVYNSLIKLAKKETSPYLHESKFILQKDAFVRLTDEDIEADTAFLSYEYNEMTTDEALDFSIYFFKEVVMINIGPINFTSSYESLGQDSTKFETLSEEEFFKAEPSVIASTILTIIKLALNGQFAVGCSWRKGKFLTGELFLHGLGHKPVTLSLVENFGVFGNTGLDYTVKQNHLIGERVKITESFSLLPETVNGKRVYPGRIVESIEGLEPLSKKEYEKLETDMHLKRVGGKREDQSVWGFMYKSYEFWVVAILYAAIYGYLRYSPSSPEFFHAGWVTPVFLLASGFVITFFATLFMAFNERRRAGRE